MALDDPKHPIPDYPAYDSESMATVLYDDFRWTANAARVIENVLDYTHFRGFTTACWVSAASPCTHT